jgi:hypothetical protein
MQGGGSGGGGGGGGSNLGGIAAAVGLGALGSLSPRFGYGIRTGMGVLNMFNENSRKKRINEVLAKHYGSSETPGEEVAVASSSDPQFFGGREQKLGLGGVTESPSPGGLSLGGGGTSLAESTEKGPMGLFSGSLEPPKSQIGKYLQIGAQAESPEQRDSLIADLIAAGADPSVTMSLAAREQARKDTLDYRDRAFRTSDERYQDTLREREIDNARADTQVDMSKERLELARKGDERAEIALDHTLEKDKRAEDYRAAAEGRHQRNEIRAVQAFEMSVQKHEATMAKIREDSKVDPKEIGDHLTSITDILSDMEMNLMLRRGQMSNEDVTQTEERIGELRKMRDELQPAYTESLERRLGMGEKSPMPMARSHGVPSTQPTAQNRYRYGEDFQ